MVAKHDINLAAATILRFGGWENALKAAGIPLAKTPLKRRWNREVVLAQIQAGHKQGLTAPQIRQADHGLAAAAKRYFGSWHAALIAAGLLPPDAKPSVFRKWSPERVIEEIQSYYEHVPHRRKAKSLVYRAARRSFGNWQKALAAAGIEDSPKLRRERRCWQILDDLRSWAQDEPSLSSKRAPNKLVCSLLYYWGTWQSVLVAAGLKPSASEISPKKTRE